MVKAENVIELKPFGGSWDALPRGLHGRRCVCLAISRCVAESRRELSLLRSYFRTNSANASESFTSNDASCAARFRKHQQEDFHSKVSHPAQFSQGSSYFRSYWCEVDRAFKPGTDLLETQLGNPEAVRHVLARRSTDRTIDLDGSTDTRHRLSRQGLKIKVNVVLIRIA